MRHEAIYATHLNVTSIDDDTGAFDKDGNKVEIDESKVSTEIDRMQAEYDAQAYARNRASAFHSIGDQLDMQYHDQLDGTTTWKDSVAKVKSDNPKPE